MPLTASWTTIMSNAAQLLPVRELERGLGDRGRPDELRLPALPLHQVGLVADLPTVVVELEVPRDGVGLQPEDRVAQRGLVERLRLLDRLLEQLHRSVAERDLVDGTSVIAP